MTWSNVNTQSRLTINEMVWEYLMSESENNPVWIGSRVNREQNNLITKDMAQRTNKGVNQPAKSLHQVFHGRIGLRNGRGPTQSPLRSTFMTSKTKRDLETHSGTNDLAQQDSTSYLNPLFPSPRVG